MKIREIQYLELMHLEAVPAIAGLLPRKIARRYHALPLAEDGERITVAMANPEDQEARQVITGILGPTVCFVRADKKIIDGLLTMFWEKEKVKQVKCLLWISQDSDRAELSAYSDHFTALLGTHAILFDTPDRGLNSCLELSREIEKIEADLVIVGGLDLAQLNRLIRSRSEKKSAKQLPNSLLIVRRSRWPIKRILLGLGNEIDDGSAVNWTVDIACASQSEVTILALTQPMLITQDEVIRMQCRIDTALNLDTKIGKKLRGVAQHLVSLGIDGTFHFRQEPPTWQIRFELLENEYDLVILDSGYPDKLWNSIMEEVTDPLLGWTDIPILITKSASL